MQKLVVLHCMYVCVCACVFSQSCRAQNCWYTARMWWSSSAVNSRFSSVPMYCWMVTWCCRGKGRGTVTREVTRGQYKSVCVCVS